MLLFFEKHLQWYKTRGYCRGGYQYFKANTPLSSNLYNFWWEACCDSFLIFYIMCLSSLDAFVPFLVAFVWNSLTMLSINPRGREHFSNAVHWPQPTCMTPSEREHSHNELKETTPLLTDRHRGSTAAGTHSEPVLQGSGKLPLGEGVSSAQAAMSHYGWWTAKACSALGLAPGGYLIL